jgi:hypothetical protein
LPPPNQLVVQFNTIYSRSLPAGSGATGAIAGASANRNIAGPNGQSVSKTLSVEINFYVDQPQ